MSLKIGSSGSLESRLESWVKTRINKITKVKLIDTVIIGKQGIFTCIGGAIEVIGRCRSMGSKLGIDAWRRSWISTLSVVMSGSSAQGRDSGRVLTAAAHSSSLGCRSPSAEEVTVGRLHENPVHHRSWHQKQDHRLIPLTQCHRNRPPLFRTLHQ